MNEQTNEQVNETQEQPKQVILGIMLEPNGTWELLPMDSEEQGQQLMAQYKGNGTFTTESKKGRVVTTTYPATMAVFAVVDAHEFDHEAQQDAQNVVVLPSEGAKADEEEADEPASN